MDDNKDETSRILFLFFQSYADCLRKFIIYQLIFITIPKISMFQYLLPDAIWQDI